VRRPDRTARQDAALAAVASALVGGLLVATSAGHRGSVAAVTAAVVAGCLVGLRLRLPTPVLIVWLYGPPVASLLDWRGEGLVFLVVIALTYLILREDDVRLRVAAGALAVAVPGGVQLVVHDDWGWPFWTGGLHITWARRRIEDDPAGSAAALRRAESIGRSGLAEIRRSVAALRDETGASLAPAMTAADVPALVGATAAAGCPATLEVSGSLAEIEPITGLAVYRVVQESLANATRYAPGAAVRVAVAVGPDEVDVTVTDGGAGRPRGQSGPGGVGLVGMRERVEALGGTLAAGPAGPGWRVRATLPRAGTPAPAPAESGGAP
jgi:hypothetical protein